ncbi:hypothetical protein HDV05_004644, partial [Chytridiales sp. JEL 0842]
MLSIKKLTILILGALAQRSTSHPQPIAPAQQPLLAPQRSPLGINILPSEVPESLHIGATVLFNPASSTCTFTSKIGPAQKNRKLMRPPYPEVVVQRKPSLLEEPLNPGQRVKVAGGDQEVVEVVGLSVEKVKEAIDELCGGSFGLMTEDDEEEGEPIGTLDNDVVKIVDNGPPSNRIDVVFMGDGYTVNERERFFADMRRLTDDMFTGPTFVSTRPLFNIWAVFQPSQESGIGVGGKPRKTSFGLYRDGTELRGIYCSKPADARRACRRTGQFACDFPSLIGNDDFYGGLGGEFTIATRSETTGTVVLRHELGHNFISVGEEYDGGYVYSGCNAAQSLNRIGWKHWLSEPDNIREEENALLVQDYSWYDLSKGPYKLRFNSTGKFQRWDMKISASGVESPGSLEVYLDGKRLDWTTSGLFDRSFYDWRSLDSGLSAGSHELEFRAGFPPATPSSPIRQLCSVTLHEYQAEPDYHFDNNFISAFPTFALNGRKTYRPTHEGCLMRNMTTTSFCPICKEGMFLQLLQKVSVIDNVETSCTAVNSHKAKVNVIPVAQFRPEPERIEGEKFEVTWYKNGVVQEKLMDNLEVEVDKVDGKWEVEVRFVTPEIRTADELDKELMVWERNMKMYKDDLKTLGNIKEEHHHRILIGRDAFVLFLLDVK